MEQITIVGLDIGKTAFQAHGASASGGVIFRKKITRSRLVAFFASLSPCTVAMEACGGAHHWARELGKLAHTIRLIPHGPDFSISLQIEGRSASRMRGHGRTSRGDTGPITDL